MGSDVDSTVHNRDLIVNAALELVDEAGVAGLTMRRVAERSGLALGTVTHHFISRDELVEECLERFYLQLEQLRREFEAEIEGESDPRALTEKAVRTLFRWAIKNRRLNRLRVITTATRGGLVPARFESSMVPFVELAARYFERHSRRSAVELKLLCYSTASLVGRSLAMDAPAQMQALTETASIERCWDAMETFYVGLVCSYVFGD
ncbi:MAG: TetR/AcrR family transcriptional regulator [Myxococcales bacterium]|nr:TetR/AcrR family transcriptional regulator [Myxococcales bacterium]